jgi:hypothetical protein
LTVNQRVAGSNPAGGAKQGFSGNCKIPVKVNQTCDSKGFPQVFHFQELLKTLIRTGKLLLSNLTAFREESQSPWPNKEGQISMRRRVPVKNAVLKSHYEKNRLF